MILHHSAGWTAISMCYVSDQAPATNKIHRNSQPAARGIFKVTTPVLCLVLCEILLSGERGRGGRHIIKLQRS